MIQVRRAKLEDVSAILDAERSTWAEALHPSEVVMLVLAGASYICLNASGDVVGHVLCVCDAERHIWIISIAVHPEYRRIGVGRRLYQSILQEAILAHALVYTSNGVSECFHARLGFLPETSMVLDGADVRVWTYRQR